MRRRSGRPAGGRTLDVEAVNSRKRQPLYQPRVKIFPKRAEGNFRRLKWLVMAVTLGIYYLTPWIRWDRGPYAPDQAVLVDLANRRFYFFFIEIWPQEFYYVAGLLIMAGLGLFLVTSRSAAPGAATPARRRSGPTSSLGRALIEGDRNARIGSTRRRGAPSKIGKRAAKSCDLAADRGRHRRRLDLLFRRRADAARAISSPARRRRSPTSPSPS